jgi:hypothetical protein
MSKTSHNKLVKVFASCNDILSKDSNSSSEDTLSQDSVVDLERDLLRISS